MPIRDIFKCCFGWTYKYNVTQVVDTEITKNNLSVDVSYGLERYKYNAMLLFCQVSSQLGDRDRSQACALMYHLMQAFERYRFTVIEYYVNLTGGGVKEKCDDFFKCDFSEYGAVVVVILAPCGASGSLAARDRPFHENVVLKHLTTHVPDSLRNKPKIFITESNCMDIFTPGHGANSFFNVSKFKDIMYLRIPQIILKDDRTPIQIFCERLNKAEDFADLEDLMNDAVEEMIEEYPLGMKELEKICTFRKRCTLPIGTDNQIYMKPLSYNKKKYELTNDGNKEYLI